MKIERVQQLERITRERRRGRATSVIPNPKKEYKRPTNRAFMLHHD